MPTPSAERPSRWRRAVEHVQRFHRDVSVAPGDPIPLATREITVILASAALIVIYHYYGLPSYFGREHLPSIPADRPLRPLYPYGYWAVSSLLIRVAIPAALVVLVFRERLRDYGFRWSRKHAGIYVGFYFAMLPLLYLASRQADFQQKYPFFAEAAEGGLPLVLYELCYGVQFFALEAFFRGFMIFGLQRRFGDYALLIMALPYCLIHFGKPLPETLGAIGAGLALGYLALRSGSFYLGALLHWGIALTMDLLALSARGG